MLALYTLLASLLTSSFIIAKETPCNLVPSESDDQLSALCNIKSLSENSQDKLVQSKLFTIEKSTGNLFWTNKYQPIETRWSKVCPSNLCLNNCDQEGFCQVGNDLKLIDNLNLDIQDKYSIEQRSKLLNVTFDLETEEREIVLIESTRSLDSFHSKPIRLLNQFHLIQNESSSLGSLKCKASSPDFFTLRHDTKNEKLYVILRFLNEDGCYVYKLKMQRAGSDAAQEEMTVLINLKDDRSEKPRFDHFVYNFTITENAPLSTELGKVRATFISQNQGIDTNFLEYRIVPFVSETSFNTQQFDLLNAPITVDYLTGMLSQGSNIDREKFLQNDFSQQNSQIKKSNKHKTKASANGLLTLNVEASYASSSYAYSKVNIFIQDVNDNAPLARISPLPRFSKRTQQNTLFVNERTAVNQILAYVAVHDPDAGENGTIKSIDLTLSSFKDASNDRVQKRLEKLTLLKKLNFNNNMFKMNSTNAQVPFILNKIGDKMYTIQLTSELDYKTIESYTIEMRIQDSGTRPQLESKTLITLNVIAQNKFAPVFVNKEAELAIEEGKKYETNVYKFIAVDLDDGRNGEVSYKIANNPFIGINDEAMAKKQMESTFSLNSNTGELFLLRALNRDEIDGDYLNLTIEAKDKAIKSRKMAKFMLKIKVVDINNNSPRFERNTLNFTIFLEPAKIVDLRAEKLSIQRASFKQIGALNIKDLDSPETNSKLFNNTSRKGFSFKDAECMKSLSLEVEKSMKHFPFVFLVEAQEKIGQKIKSTECRLSIWLDLNDSNGMNTINHREFIDFTLKVSDNGVQKAAKISSTSVRINISSGKHNLFQFKAENNTLNFKDNIKIEADIAQNSIAQFSFKNSSRNISVEIRSVTELHENSSILYTTEPIFKLVTKNSGNIEIETIGNVQPGVYLIDLIMKESSNKSSFEQIQLVLGDEKLSEILQTYNEKNEITLSNEISSDSDLLRFQGLLFSRSADEFSIQTALFNTQSTINQFIILVCIFVLIIILLFACCICLLIRRKCCGGIDKNDNASIKKKLNVSDASSKLDAENAGFTKIRTDQSSQKSAYDDASPIYIDPKDKVSRYLEGLSSIGSNDIMINTDNLRNVNASPPTSLSSLDNSSKKCSDNQQNSIKSITSMSCISDEGCYGSSDFSSEANVKHGQFNKQSKQSQQQNYFSPSSVSSGQQAHYIHNLSRFEKIYNNKENNFSSPSSEIFRSNACTPNPANQVITAISGSYV